MTVTTDTPGPAPDVSPRATAFLRRLHGLWIDGQDRAARGPGAGDGGRLDVYDPSTGGVIATIAAAGAADVDDAVAAARASFRDGRWARRSPSDREEVLRRLADLLVANGEEIAQLDTLDNGMPLTQARGEVRSSASHLRYFAGRAADLGGDIVTPYRGGDFAVSARREPIGVIGAITAWNTPLENAVWKIGAALAAGNSMVLKPAEETPLSALRLAELATEAGLPDGVLNVVSGTGETAGAALSSHPDVDRVAFTGSTETGRRIVTASAANLKRVTLELGGKSPVLVLPDADLDKYIERIVAAVMWNTGQVCTAGSRVYVHRDIASDFVRMAAGVIENMVVGPGLDERTQVGPVVSAVQRDRVLGYISAGQAEGATRSVGGRTAGGDPVLPQPGEAGYFVPPVIFSDVRDDMRIAREEIFGPVMSVLEFTDTDDVVERANHSDYGLAAGIWTSSVSTAHQLARRLETGTVWVNCYNQFDPAVPFGGVKQSGYGREMGLASLEECTSLKTTWIGLD
jgi:aldehyde dehydrogenase (NAD+)